MNTNIKIGQNEISVGVTVAAGREVAAYIGKKGQTELVYMGSIQQAACEQDRLGFAGPEAAYHLPNKWHIPQYAHDQLSDRVLPANYRQL